MKNSKALITFNNEIEVQTLTHILKEENIPHVVVSHHDSAYDGLWQSQMGWGHLEAPEEYREEILEIYRKMNEE